MKDFTFVIKSWTIWRITLFLAAFLAIFWLPIFGARFPYYDRVLEITKLPNWIWGFGNFDGVHYLRIAQDGYKAQFSQAFFPLFPLLVRFFSLIFPRVPNLDTNINTDPSFFYSGLILSNLFFISSIFVFYKLLKLDFDNKIAKWSIIFLLVFPTSFYFGAIYTESLFLLLSVSAIYLIRKKKYFYSSILIALASATRLTGIFLVLIYIIEIYKDKNFLKLIYLPVTTLGTILYMFYLKSTFGNPFYFLTAQPVFGASRLENGIVWLPQVIYRYVKIFLTTKVLSLPFLNAALEFLFTIIPLTFFVFLVKKMRLSYFIFSVCTLLLPTFTGTLSSMPRYVLLSIFLLIPYIIQEYREKFKIAILPMIILGLVLVSLFVRGYWVA